METNSKSEAPSFIVPVHEATLHSEMLKIPPLFVRHLSKDLSDEAVLEGPTGDYWILTVKLSAQGINLQDGWHDFVTANRLEANGFMCVKYFGDMRFKVDVFDASGCKKEFAARRSESVPTEVQKRKRRSGSDQDFPRCELPKVEKEMSSEKKDNKKTFPAGIRFHSFASENQFIKLRISKSSLYGRRQGLNHSFGRKHLPQMKTKMKLCHGDGRIWVVTFLSNDCNSFFCGGWSAFVRECELEEDDRCIFELIGQDAFQVHIFKGNLI